MRSFRLEFKQRTQQLRLDNGTHEPNTKGWVTVIDSITDEDQKIFFMYFDSLTPKKRTSKDIIKIGSEFITFMESLKENKRKIIKENDNTKLSNLRGRLPVIEF